MRLIVMLAFTATAVGCGQKDTGGVKDGSGVGAESASFDANEYAATSNWLRTKVKSLEETRRGKNELATQHALKAFNADLGKHTGKRVSWKVPVERVEGDGVHFQSGRLAEPDPQRPAARNLPVWLVITAVKGADVSEDLKSYDGPAFGRAVIGQAISKDRAAQLRHGNPATVTGTLKRFDLDGYADALYCNAIVTEAEIKP